MWLTPGKIASLAHVKDSEIVWNVAGKRRCGAIFEWTTASPGPYLAHIEVNGHRVQTVPITVGIRPHDIVERRESLDFFFCLIVRKGAKVTFLSLFAPAQQNEDTRSEAQGPSSRSLRAKERSWRRAPRSSPVGAPSVGNLRYGVLQKPFFEVGRVADGLYAIVPNSSSLK